MFPVTPITGLVNFRFFTITFVASNPDTLGITESIKIKSKGISGASPATRAFCSNAASEFSVVASPPSLSAVISIASWPSHASSTTLPNLFNTLTNIFRTIVESSTTRTRRPENISVAFSNASESNFPVPLVSALLSTETASLLTSSSESEGLEDIYKGRLKKKFEPWPSPFEDIPVSPPWAFTIPRETTYTMNKSRQHLVQLIFCIYPEARLSYHLIRTVQAKSRPSTFLKFVRFKLHYATKYTMLVSLANTHASV
mmetsp:Transcript_12285/g.19999  ORF Transcript_12285/g.19999 Transcript_12285/m.19999 type:complete len:257 (-) Transcript_12285:621-1391(-)